MQRLVSMASIGRGGHLVHSTKDSEQIGLDRLRKSVMSFSESRNHFEKARINTADAVTIEMLDGLKHLSHAIEENFRSLEQDIRDIQESAINPKARP